MILSFEKTNCVYISASYYTHTHRVTEGENKELGGVLKVVFCCSFAEMAVCLLQVIRKSCGCFEGK